MEKESPSVLVLAYPGTETLVKRIWTKFFAFDAEVITFDEGSGLQQVLEIVMMYPDLVSEDFVLVPANLVPVTPIAPEELRISLVDKDGNKERFFGRVPVRFNKQTLADFIPENDTLDDEAFVKKYVERHNARPLEVSHNSGNYFTKVLRANPCENVVIEAFLRKHFVYASPQGWQAITGLLQKLISE